MELKGIKALNKTVSAQLKPFGISKAELSDEYAYYYDNEKVTYKITENTLEDRFFIDFVKDRFGYNVRYPFIFSLLHEVGHHKTGDDVEGLVYDFCQKEKARINKAMAKTKTEKQAKKLEYQYFNLPDEILATAWAVKWSRRNPQKIEKMWEEIKNSLLTFYNINDIIDDESEVDLNE